MSDERILSYKKVSERLGVGRSSLYRYRSEIPDFPKPVRLGPQTRRVGFLASEVEAFIKARPRVTGGPGK